MRFLTWLFCGLLFLALVHFSSPQLMAQKGKKPPSVQLPRLETPPQPLDEKEKAILEVMEDINKNQRYVNVPEDDGRLLRVLAEAMGAKNVVEIGTSTGYSGLWFSLALRKTGGKLVTHEIDPGRAAQAQENFKRAGVDNLITIVKGNAHETTAQLKEKLTGPIDLLFLDADRDGYMDYMKKLFPMVRPGGLILTHNMRPPGNNAEYTKAITTNPELESIFLNMHAAGMGVTLKRR